MMTTMMKIAMTPDMIKTTFKVLQRYENKLRLMMCMELNGCYGDSPFLPSESSGQTKSHNSHSLRHVITTPAMEGGTVAIMRRENIILSRRNREQY